MGQYRLAVLVVDDDPAIVEALKFLLSNEFNVLTAGDAEAAQRQFAGNEIDVILTDHSMPGATGIQLLEWVKQYSPRTIRLLMTGHADLEQIISAINTSQVYRFLLKPWQPEDLQETVRSAAKTFILERNNLLLVDELQKLNDRLQGMNTELENRVAERTRALEDAYHELEHKNKMLEKLALTDPGTNLPNRRAMERLVERELRRRERHDCPIAIAVVDVDNFGLINKNKLFLWSGGDQILIDLARCLSSSVRLVDFVGRIGGEEFLVIAPETNLEGALILGERIRSMVEATEFSYKGEVIPVRVSVGIAVAEAGVATDYPTIKETADAALLEAKDTGRNKCVYKMVPPLPLEQAS